MCFGLNYHRKPSTSSSTSAFPPQPVDRNKVLSRLKFAIEKLDHATKESERRKTYARQMLLEASADGERDLAGVYRENVVRHDRDIIFYGRLQSQLESMCGKVRQAQSDSELMESFIAATRELLDGNADEILAHIDTSDVYDDVLAALTRYIEGVIDDAASSTVLVANEISEDSDGSETDPNSSGGTQVSRISFTLKAVKRASRFSSELLKKRRPRPA